MKLRRRAMMMAAAMGSALLGWFLWPSSSPPSPPPRIDISIVAPDPPIVALPFAQPASPDEAVLVVATLPDEEGSTGLSIVTWGPNILTDERMRSWRALRGLNPVLEPDSRDGLRTLLDVLGGRPADWPELLVAISPELAGEGLLMEGEWRMRDVRRGVAPASAAELYANERRLANALVNGAPGTIEANKARRELLWMEAGEAPESEREQVMWEGAIELIADGVPEAGFMASGLITNPPRISLQDHGILAAACGTPNGSVAAADLMLRDALGRGDDDWVRFWWACLENASVPPDAENLEYWDWVSRNRAQLSGSVTVRLGEASTWEDGLRRAAVLCAEREVPVPFRAQLRFGDAWEVLEIDNPGPYTDCVLALAEPRPLESQRALLMVRAATRSLEFLRDPGS